MMGVRRYGVNRWWGGAVALVWGTAACGSVFSSDDDCTASRTCPPAEAGAGGDASDGGAANAAGAGAVAGADGDASGVGGEGGVHAGDILCVRDADCDDEDPSNGEEQCRADGACLAGDPPPAVIAMTPSDGEEGVAPSATIELTFSEELDAETVTGDTVRLLRGDTRVDVSVAYAAGNVIKIEPKQLLTLLGEYEVVVSRDVTDLAGIGLVEDYRASFQVHEGTWETPDAHSEVANDLADHIALDDDGNAIVAWSGPSWLSIRQGIVQGPVSTASPPGGPVLFASLPGGPTLLYWQAVNWEGLDLSTGVPDELVSFSAGISTRFQITPGGDATLLRNDWTEGLTAFVRTNRGWATKKLTTTGYGFSAPQMAFDEHSNGVAVWRTEWAPNQHSIQITTFSSQTAMWSDAAPLPGGASRGPAWQGRGAAPTVAMSPDGLSVVLWVDQPKANGPCVLWSKALTSSGAAVALTDVTQLAVSCHDDAPALVFDGETFVAAFTGNEPGKAAATYTMRWDMAAQAWEDYEKRQAAGEPEATARMPRLGTDGAGSLFLLWSTGAGSYELHYQRYAGGGWTASAAVPNSSFQDPLFVAGKDGELAPPLPLAMNRVGMVAIAWGDHGPQPRLRFASLQ